MGVVDKVKDKYFNYVPSWHEIAFIVNLVSIYAKTRDMVYNLTYQVRLIQSTIRLAEKQKEWVLRTRGMIDNMRTRGFSLYELEMSCRDVSYMTGTHYKYLAYLSGRIADNGDNLLKSFGNYADILDVPADKKAQELMKIYGFPNTIGFTLVSTNPANRLQAIYEANLGAITRADAKQKHAMDVMQDLNNRKTALLLKTSDQTEQINTVKLIQQIAMINLKRAEIKLALSDILLERNKLYAYRILSQTHIDRTTKALVKYNGAAGFYGMQ
jgi:hypothetical protein